MATAAAIVAKARRDVISHLMSRNAVAPDKAVEWVPDRRIQRRQIERMVDAGVIVSTGTDRYYLHVPAYDEWRRKLRRRAAFVMASLVAIGAAVAAIA